MYIYFFVNFLPDTYDDLVTFILTSHFDELEFLILKYRITATFILSIILGS